MTELTISMAKDMDFVEWVQHFRPEWSEDECVDYLWEHTCFPFGFKDVIKQLNEQLT